MLLTYTNQVPACEIALVTKPAKNEAQDIRLCIYNQYKKTVGSVFLLNSSTIKKSVSDLYHRS